MVGGELGYIGSIFIQLNIKYSFCLEYVARSEAGEDEASHQLGVGDDHTVSADKVKVLTHDVTGQPTGLSNTGESLSL